MGIDLSACLDLWGSKLGGLSFVYLRFPLISGTEINAPLYVCQSIELRPQQEPYHARVGKWSVTFHEN